MPSSCCRPEPTPSRSAPPPSGTPSAPWQVLRQLARWCRRPRHDGRRHPAAVRRPRRRGTTPDDDSGDSDDDASTRNVKEDAMADSFGDRVAAAVRGPGRCAPASTPRPSLLHGVGPERRRARGCAPSRDVRRGVRRRGRRGQATGRVLRAARRGRHGRARAARRRRHSGRPRRHRRRQARRHRLDRRRPTPTRGSATASPLAADAVTVHPYLGLGALAPLVHLAAANGRGVIVVVRSSNPEGRALQQAVTADGTSVEDTLLGEIAALNGSRGGPGRHRRRRHRGHAAAVELPVVPARRGNSGPRPRRPGRRPRRRGGALRRLPRPGSVLPSSSRGLLRHGPDPDDSALAAPGRLSVNSRRRWAEEGKWV